MGVEVGVVFLFECRSGHLMKCHFVGITFRALAWVNGALPVLYKMLSSRP